MATLGDDYTEYAQWNGVMIYECGRCNALIVNIPEHDALHEKGSSQ